MVTTEYPFLCKQAFVGALFTIAAVVLVILDWLPGVNAIVFFGFMLLLQSYRYFEANNTTFIMPPLWFLTLCVGFFLAIYRPDHFNYPLMFSQSQLHPGGFAFDLRVNTAKLLAGWIVIVLFWRNTKNVIDVFGQNTFARVVFTVFMALAINGLAYQLLNLHWYSKEMGLIAQFLLVNVLVTCVAEEAFFRVLIQRRLMISCEGLPFWVRLTVPLVTTTVLFLAVHGELTTAQFFVHAIAGLSYGLLYSITGNVWYCVALHAGVNAIHFTFLTYPVVV